LNKSKQQAGGFQKILKARQQKEFVGRDEEQRLFRENLACEPDDEQRRFVINASGQGGVGKTSLLRTYLQRAKDAGAVTAWTDDAERDVCGVLARLVEELSTAGHPCKAFQVRHQPYDRIRHGDEGVV
jgi:hypothetical protein